MPRSSTPKPADPQGLAAFDYRAVLADGTDNEERRHRGRSHMSAVMVYWLTKNGWSHPQFCRLAAWALNERSAVHESQLSHLRNAKTKLMGVKCLDALGQVNLAVWAWHTGNEALLEILGVGEVTQEIRNLVENATWLERPVVVKPGEKKPASRQPMPMDQASFMALYLGYIQLPDVVNGPEGDPSFQLIVDKFGVYMQDVVKGAKPRIEISDLMPMLTKAMGDSELAEALVMSLLGVKQMDANFLTQKFALICRALTTIDGKLREPAGVVQEIRDRYL